MKVSGRLVGSVLAGSLVLGAGPVGWSASAQAARGLRHHRVVHRAHLRHHREEFEPVAGEPVITGPVLGGLLGIGISGAGAADGYGYGGYQRRQDYPAGYGYYGRGYLGPSYSYTGY